MEYEDIERLFNRQLQRGGPIQDAEEWHELVPAMYEALIERAKTTPYDSLPISYSELGAWIGLPFVPDSKWWPLKMAHLLGACAFFEHTNERPMITSIVVNNETKRPGQGFWGIDGIPSKLRLESAHEDQLSGLVRSELRDEFWIQAMKAVYEYWWGKHGMS